MIPAAAHGLGTLAVLPGVPESAGRARAVVRRVLGPDHPAAQAAATCVSELAANAINHTPSGLPGGTFTLSVHDGGDAVRIAVTDVGSNTRPRARRPRLTSTHGRGLAIVAAVAAAWGNKRTGSGQITWCEIHASDTKIV
jgi:anti-sigma regulatory factor (Ser/Thr protein kinase)